MGWDHRQSPKDGYRHTKRMRKVQAEVTAWAKARRQASNPRSLCVHRPCPRTEAQHGRSTRQAQILVLKVGSPQSWPQAWQKSQRPAFAWLHLSRGPQGQRVGPCCLCAQPFKHNSPPCRAAVHVGKPQPRNRLARSRRKPLQLLIVYRSQPIADERGSAHPRPCGALLSAKVSYSACRSMPLRPGERGPLGHLIHFRRIALKAQAQSRAKR